VRRENIGRLANPNHTLPGQTRLALHNGVASTGRSRSSRDTSLPIFQMLKWVIVMRTPKVFFYTPDTSA